jgi:hypothetical protein
MKCISLWQPWASLCVIGAKKFETRSWERSYRGTLLIHASQRHTKEIAITCFNEPFFSTLKAAGTITGGDDEEELAMPFGGIIGVAELTMIFMIEGDGLYRFGNECTECDGTGSTGEWGDAGEIQCGACEGRGRTILEQLDLPEEPELSFGDYAPGRFAWKLENPRRFETPIPFRGRQQLFDVPDELVAEQMAKAVPA